MFDFRHYESLRENKMRCFSCGICQTNESEARFIRRISAVSNSIQRIKFGRNSTSESAAAFLPHVRLVLSHYPTEMRHRFKRRISAVSNLIHTLC